MKEDGYLQTCVLPPKACKNNTAVSDYNNEKLGR